MSWGEVTNLVTIVGIIVGGLFAYYKFVRRRLYVPRVGLEMTARIDSSTGSCIVDLTVSNLGESRLRFASPDVALRLSESQVVAVYPIDELEWVVSEAAGRPLWRTDRCAFQCVYPSTDEDRIVLESREAARSSVVQPLPVSTVVARVEAWITVESRRIGLGSWSGPRTYTVNLIVSADQDQAASAVVSAPALATADLPPQLRPPGGGGGKGTHLELSAAEESALTGLQFFAEALRTIDDVELKPSTVRRFLTEAAAPTLTVLADLKHSDNPDHLKLRELARAEQLKEPLKFRNVPVAQEESETAPQRRRVRAKVDEPATGRTMSVGGEE